MIVDSVTTRNMLSFGGRCLSLELELLLIGVFVRSLKFPTFYLGDQLEEQFSFKMIKFGDIFWPSIALWNKSHISKTFEILKI